MSDIIIVMEKRYLRSLALLLLLFTPGFSKVRLTTIMHVPTTDFLANMQYTIGAHDNIYAYKTHPNDTVLLFGYTPVVGGNLGIVDRIEFGAAFAGGPSVNFKALILKEGQSLFHPGIALGVRDIVSSAEGAFFGLEDEVLLEQMANTVFIAGGKNFDALGSRIHFGILSNWAMKDEKISPFGAIEIYLGGGFYLTYEAYRRFKGFPQFLNIAFRLKKSLIVSFGLTELKHVLFSDGKLGFKLFPADDFRRNGYDSPGLNFSLFYSGFFRGKGTGNRTLNDEINALNKNVSDLERKTRNLTTQLERTEQHLSGLDEDFALIIAGKDPEKAKDYRIAIPHYMKTLRELLSNEGAYNVEEVSLFTKKITSYGGLALPALYKIIRTPLSNPKMTALAIQMLGTIGNKGSKKHLLRLLDYKQSSIKIDAIVSLGKLRDMGVAKELERALKDTDRAVAIAAQKVILNLTGKNLPLPRREKKKPEEKPKMSSEDEAEKKPAEDSKEKSEEQSTASDEENKDDSPKSEEAPEVEEKGKESVKTEEELLKK